MKCDYKGCKEEGRSMCIIYDLDGWDYHRCFCGKHLKKMLYNEKDAVYDER